MCSGQVSLSIQPASHADYFGTLLLKTANSKDHLSVRRRRRRFLSVQSTALKMADMAVWQAITVSQERKEILGFVYASEGNLSQQRKCGRQTGQGI